MTAGEELVLLIDILDKLGYNTESAGSGTIFQRLAQLAGYVDDLETRLTATRAGYLDLINTLNSRLTDTRAGKLDLVGNTDDAAGTGSIFARLAQIAGYTDTVEANMVKALGTVAGTFSTASATLQTALNLTGPGELYWLTVQEQNYTGSEIKITLDGNVIYNKTPLNSGGVTSLMFKNGGGFWMYNPDINVTHGIKIPFRNSLLVQLKSDGTNAILLSYVYAI